MNFKIVEFLLVSALFCSEVLASVMISTGSYVASCGGDPVGGARAGNSMKNKAIVGWLSNTIGLAYRYQSRAWLE